MFVLVFKLYVYFYHMLLKVHEMLCIVVAICVSTLWIALLVVVVVVVLSTLPSDGLRLLLVGRRRTLASQVVVLLLLLLVMVVLVAVLGADRGRLLDIPVVPELGEHVAEAAVVALT